MILDDKLGQQDSIPHLSDNELFKLILIAPAKAIRYIEQHDYKKYFTLLLFAIGAVSSLNNNFMSRYLMLHTPYVVSLFLSAVIGGVIGAVFIYIYANIIRFTGKWLGGKASASSIARVYVYTSIPSLMMFLVFMAKLFYNGFLGNDLLYTPTPFPFVGTIISLISFILTIWAFILFIGGLAEVQQFSIGKALLNIFILTIPIVFVLIIMNIMDIMQLAM